MSKRHSAKYKLDRAMGENLWGRAKSPVNKRSYGPGQHGQRRKSKVSDFGLQLKAKQKLKGYYGNITEKQFAKTYDEAARRKGNTSENLIGLLESRLDAIVYRAKFVPTVWAARQFVSHGHVTVNGKKVDIASYRVKTGDVVKVKVMEVDVARKRIGLTMRLDDAPAREGESGASPRPDRNRPGALSVKGGSYGSKPAPPAAPKTGSFGNLLQDALKKR